MLTQPLSVRPQVVPLTVLVSRMVTTVPLSYWPTTE